MIGQAEGARICEWMSLSRVTRISSVVLLVLFVSGKALAQEELPPAPEVMQGLDPEPTQSNSKSVNANQNSDKKKGSKKKSATSNSARTRTTKGKKSRHGSPRPQVESNNLVDDQPDSIRESRLNQIYRSYNSQRTPDESWDKVVGSKKTETYRVQNGDTLSGLSKTLFGEPNFWPKLWSANTSVIENPHEIEPGMILRFLPGSASSPPGLSVDSVKVASASSEFSFEKNEIRPVAKLPSSLPAYNYPPPPAVSTDFEGSIADKNSKPIVADLSYELADSALIGVGFVSETEMGLSSATDFQYVYVKLNKEISEKYFSVYRNLEQLKDPYSSKTIQIVEAQGELEILEQVNPSRNIYRAMIRKTIQPIQVGSILMPGKIPTFTASKGANAKGPEARVIGGQFSHNRSMFGDQSLIFLNAGSSEGVKVDSYFNVYSNQRLRNQDTSAKVNDLKIASIKIVQVTEHFSTAFVIEAHDYIRVGDHLGTIQDLSGEQESEMVKSFEAVEQKTDVDVNSEVETAADPALTSELNDQKSPEGVDPSVATPIEDKTQSPVPNVKPNSGKSDQPAADGELEL